MRSRLSKLIGALSRAFILSVAVVPCLLMSGMAHADLVAQPSGDAPDTSNRSGGGIDLGQDKAPPSVTGWAGESPDRGSPAAVIDPEAISGPGFNAMYPGNMGNFTLKLVTSGEGNVETLRTLADWAAAELRSITGGSFAVAGGQTSSTAPATGEIVIMLSSSSGCPGTGWAGCGGPASVSCYRDGCYAMSGHVWIHPSVAGYSIQVRQQVMSHEIGHALGLDHFDGTYAGAYQVMGSTATGINRYQAGDTNGLRQLSNAGNPFGYLDSASSPGPGQLRVTGWAIDPNTTSPTDVHIYPTPTSGVAIAANKPRPDVASAYPWAGPNHGFDSTIDVAGGSYNVCGYGINYGPGRNVGLNGNCKTVNVAAPTVPGAPTNVVATAGDRSATVTWSAPSTGGSPITTYTLTASPGGATATVASPSTTATINGLTNGTAYTFTVKAANARGAGPASSPSNSVTPATRPGAPLSVVAVGGDASATVSWSVPSSNGGQPLTGYRVVAAPGGATVNVSASSMTATVSGLTNGTAYTFVVYASNAVGEGAASSPSNAVTPQVQRPLNDAFGAATPIGAAGGSLRGTNLGATHEDGEPDHSGRPTSASVWFTWTPQANGFVTISTAGSDFDTVLAVYTGTGVESVTEVASNDDWPIGVLTSEVGFMAVRGVTYKIALDGYYGATGDISLGVTQEAASGRFNALSPTRVLDSRTGLGGFVTPWGPGWTRELFLTGTGGVPSSGVSAVLVNATVTGTTAASHMTIWPSPASRPEASSLNWTTGQTVANLVLVPLGPAGAADVFNNAGSAHLILDVVGWYGTTGQQLNALAPARVLDSRVGVGWSGPWVGGWTRDVYVQGVGGVPTSGVTSVVMNVTVTNASADSHLTIWPSGQSRPNASNINWRAGETRSNLVVVPVGPNRTVSVYDNSGTVDVIFDVVGWHSSAGAELVAVTPTRLLDSRTGIGGWSTPWGAGFSRDVQLAGNTPVPPIGVRAVAVQVTITDATADSHLSVWPTGQARPNASNLNWRAGETRSNLVVVPIDANGGVSIFNNAGSVNVILDIVGWYA